MKAVARFHRWSRKGYAVFNSLHKVVAIGTLTISCSIISTPCKSQHKPDTTEISRILEIDSVVVTAQREPVVASKVTRPVLSVTKSEIEGAPARTIESLLEFLPGVDVRTRGTYGTQSDISIRGGTFDQTLVLLNGISMSDPHTGHHSMNLPVDPDAIEKIEVLTGPAARIFGANAYNGVVNLITRPAGQQKVLFRLTGGDFGLYNANATLNLKTGKVKHLFNVGKSGSNGFTKNTDFQTFHAFAHSLAELKLLTLEAQAGYSDRGFGANSFYSPKYPDQYEQTRTINASVKAYTSGRIRMSQAIFWRRNYDRFELFRSDAPSWYSGHNYHRSDVVGGSINGSAIWRGGKSSVGGEYRHESILSNVLGTEMITPVPVEGEVGVNYTRSGARDCYNLFAEHTVYLGKITVNGGVLGYYTPGYTGRVRFYPGVEAGYSISPSFHLSAAFNRTLRLPTFTDLYYTTPTNVANPDLLPEEASVWEAGLRYRLQKYTAEVNGFFREGTNMIDWVQYPGDEKWYSTNTTKVNISGFEASVRYQSKINKGNFSVRQWRISWQYTRADKASEGLLSKYVLDNLKHKVDAMADIQMPAGFAAQVKGSYQQREGVYLRWPDNIQVAYKPVWLVDFQFSRVMGNLTVFAEVSNLFNVDYIDHANVPQPGRWFRGGIVYQSAF